MLKNTYILLSMTLLFSAVTAGISMAVNPPPFTGLVCSGLAMLLLWFGLGRTANSAAGIYMVFAITGLLGFGLGPLLNAYTATANGSALVMQALGGTGIVFFTLSGYALTTRKDFSYMGGFLFTGLIVALIAIVANIFLQIPALSLAISSVVILIMSGLILYDTSRIINGGETNYGAGHYQPVPESLQHLRQPAAPAVSPEWRRLIATGSNAKPRRCRGFSFMSVLFSGNVHPYEIFAVGSVSTACQ